MKLEIMDTTLRDGEQTAGVAFTPREKLEITRALLSEARVDRVELASARVSEGEFESVKAVTAWAAGEGLLGKIEVLGFVDGKKSAGWIYEAGGRVMNLLCKGSLRHLRGQLGKEPAEHLQDARQAVEHARSLGLAVNVYLEDWSNGMRESGEYVRFLLSGLSGTGVSRFMLPDTLGLLEPRETGVFMAAMVHDFPNLVFDFHAHNDYGLAVANTLEAVRAGVHGVHVTVSGLGERTGNAPLEAVAVALRDFLAAECALEEKALYDLSRLVERLSGVNVPVNMPVTGRAVFTQVCGVHADGDRKGGLYTTALHPSRFGRDRQYALGKTSGKASVRTNLEALGLEADEETVGRLTRAVVERGDRKMATGARDLERMFLEYARKPG